MIRNPFFPRLTWATNQPIGPINEKRESGVSPESLLFNSDGAEGGLEPPRVSPPPPLTNKPGRKMQKVPSFPGIP